MAERRGGKVVVVDPADIREDDEMDGDDQGGAPNGGIPDTGATRKTKDMYFSLLGTDKAGTGHVIVNFLENGMNSSETRVLKAPADKYTKDELIEVVRLKHAPKIHPGERGDYRVWLYVHNGKQLVCAGNEMFTVLADSAPQNALVAAAGTDPALIALLSRNQQQMEQLRADLAALKNTGDKGIDVAGILTVATPLLLPLLTAWIARPKDDPMKALTTALALTGTIKDMRAEGETIEHRDEMPWWVPAVTKLADNLPMALSAMASARGGQTSAMAGPGTSPAGNPQSPLYPYLDKLVQAAVNDADPEQVAEVWLRDILPEPARPMVLAKLAEPTAFKELAAIHPGVMDYPVFFVDLIAALLELAQSVHTPPDSGQGTTHDHANGTDTQPAPGG